VQAQTRLKASFQGVLAGRLPNLSTFSEEALDNVYDVLVRKLCNTRIQEVVSAAKQKMAAKKGLASTVDTNLRPVLLAQHTKLETKLNTKSSTTCK